MFAWMYTKAMRLLMRWRVRRLERMRCTNGDSCPHCDALDREIWRINAMLAWTSERYR